MFLFEACEYMDSFLDFRPTVAVLLNAELEHVDYFRDLSQIEDSFFRFASLTGRDGVTVCNADDACVSRAAARALAAGGTGRVVTFSAQGTAADVCAHGVQLERGLPTFTLVVDGEAWGEVCLRVPGIHQVCDALAAVAAAWVCGLARADILRGLADLPALPSDGVRGKVRGGSCLTTTGLIRPRSVPHWWGGGTGRNTPGRNAGTPALRVPAAYIQPYSAPV